MDLETINNRFDWSPEDWERAKAWAESLPAPIQGVDNLWNWAKGDDSTWTLHRLNAYVRNLKRTRRLDSSLEKIKK
jgi:hypothetical protein